MASSKPQLGKSLAETHPEIAAQADGWDASSLLPGSHQNRQWVCAFGHYWSAQVRKRALRGDGCPYCSGKKVLAGFNDLLTTHPELAAQADGWDPTTVSYGSGQNRQWVCSIGHSWSTITWPRASPATPQNNVG